MTEILIKVEANVISPTKFAKLVAENGVPVGKSFWIPTGSVDSIKCIIISHKYNITKHIASVENKYTLITITNE
jgi:hypothetical protein